MFVWYADFNSRFVSTVYASMFYEGGDQPTVISPPLNPQELMVAATLDYCIDAANQRGYTIVNAQEVLEWLHRNVELVGHPA